ncbi:type IV pilus biogenesis/stability protein PilW [Thiohalocapsa marina]|nr:type IV pilus biogenesis/stability protein PilW [Thiohalocapsa marina]
MRPPRASTGPSARASLAVALLCALLAGCANTPQQQEMAELAPKESPADLYVNMAAAYYQSGKLDIALERGLRALREDRKNPKAHYVLGIVYQALGKTTEAAQSLAEAVRLDPDNPDFHNARGSLLCLQQRYGEALAEFQQALQNPLYKTPEVALVNAADCTRRAGDATASERYLREALSRNAQYAPALMAMARLNYQRGAYLDARGYLARYSRSGPATPEALLLAYRIETALGNRNDAKALARQLRQRFPDSPQIMQL